jgi:hypothetical protein
MGTLAATNLVIAAEGTVDVTLTEKVVKHHIRFTFSIKLCLQEQAFMW